MKHIREIIAVKKQQLERGQLSLFEQPSEKGSSEWSAFNAVRGDETSSYSVSLPRRKTVSEPSRALRLIYPGRFRTAD